MRLAVSYFYQIRNFKENMIPVSTAMWDPSWYHDNKGPTHIFIDKRGIINGLRILPLHPGEECEGLCRGRQSCAALGPENCAFLKAYRQQLEKIDLEKLLKDMNNLAEAYREERQLKEEPIIVLIVYEAPNNPCSERRVLIEYFNSKGINCQELEYPIQKPSKIPEDTFDF